MDRARGPLLLAVCSACRAPDSPGPFVPLGPAGHYAASEVVHIPERRVFLVVGATGAAEGLVAVRDVDPWSGCTVRWVRDIDLFTDPCYGSFWARDGTAVAGPSGHALVSLPAPVRAGMVEPAASGAGAGP